MSPPKPTRFPYRLSGPRFTLALLLGLGVSTALSIIALTNTKPIRLLGVVTVAPELANLGFWTLAALALAASTEIIWAAMRNRRALGYVELQDNEVLLPEASSSQRLLRIPYTSIVALCTAKVGSQQMLVVKSPIGESRLLEEGFSSQHDFAIFCELLSEQANAHRHAASASRG